MLEDVGLQVAIIAAVVGIIGGVAGTYLKHFLDKRSLRHRLEIEYEYEERKRLRSLIGLYHGRMLFAAEHLNNRLWNLQANESKGWLIMNGKYSQPNKHYYFVTTAHRFVNLLGLVCLFQKEALYIDSRIAEGSDLVFLKFAKSLEWALTNVALFEGLQYDAFYQRDHFFVDYLRLVCDSCSHNDSIMSLTDFQSHIVNCVPESTLFDFLQFFDGLCASENRLRWDRIIAFHLLLMAFINNFGYDMQKSTTGQFIQIAGSSQNKQALQNLNDWLTRLGLDSEKEAKQISMAVTAAMPSN